jgi:hypothetical protein
MQEFQLKVISTENNNTVLDFAATVKARSDRQYCNWGASDEQ